MGKMFFWMTEAPDQANIVAQTWSGFLDSMAVLSLGIVAGFTLLIVLGYVGSVKGRKVRTPNDLFSAYTPMYWLLLALLGGIAAACVCAWRYHDLLPPESAGQFSTSAYVGLWTAAWAFLLGYLIVLIPGITPPKFRYRPLWLFYHGRGARKA